MNASMYTTNVKKDPVQAVEQDAIGFEFHCTDGDDAPPPQRTNVEGANVIAWLSKDFTGLDDYPLQLITRCGTVDELSESQDEPHMVSPFSAEVLDKILGTYVKQYKALQQSLGAGSAYLPYKILLQTPLDGGPFCSMALMTYGKALVRGFYFYTDDVYSPLNVLEGSTLYSGWRSTGSHIMVLPVAFLGTHVTGVVRDIRALSRRIGAIEQTLSQPDSSGNDRHDFGMITRKLYECSRDLLKIEQRAVFNAGLVRTIEQYLEFARSQRVSWLDPLTAPLEASKNMIEAQSHDIKALPRRIKTQQTMVFNLTIQRDSRLSLEIAQTSRDLAEASRHIAEATMRDSASMKTIAILTMLFLPGTAVASFFSMTMFNWSPGPNQAFASSYVWIYFVVALPLTMLTIGIWYMSQRRRRERRLASFPGFPVTSSSPTRRTHSNTKYSQSQHQGLGVSSPSTISYKEKGRLNGINHDHDHAA